MVKRIIVGMSGGVDSSVAAFLLKQQGFEVTGLFMRNWEEEEECPAVQDYEDVVAVCHHIGIPYYTVNLAKEYWERVFSRCLEEYAAGYTPNPDILCNKEIKFNVFLRKALELGADALATGHYCRRLETEEGWGLGRGRDPDKDQSYFLYTLQSAQLARVLFPVGEMTKKEVRECARAAGLPTANKKDSTGICFIGKRDFRKFLSRYIPETPGGRLETLEGECVGEHAGAAYYTLGQRKGLGIGGAGEAWYVVGKDMARNVVYVAQGDTHPALFQTQLVAHAISWVEKAPAFPFACRAKIRYRTPDVPCTVTEMGPDQLRVVFETPQKAITPRQAIVFYQGERCLGGGTIS